MLIEENSAREITRSVLQPRHSLYSDSSSKRAFRRGLEAIVQTTTGLRSTVHILKTLLTGCAYIRAQTHTEIFNWFRSQFLMQISRLPGQRGMSYTNVRPRRGAFYPSLQSKDG